MENEKVMSFADGGTVAEFVSMASGNSFDCTCGATITVKDIRGYPHEGGIPDLHGKKWWVYVRCNKCRYDWSWWKVESRL
jgi:hypothetical protein